MQTSHIKLNKHKLQVCRAVQKVEISQNSFVVKGNMYQAVFLKNIISAWKKMYSEGPSWPMIVNLQN